MDWFHLTQGRGISWAVLNKLINFRVPENAGNLLTL
jgi:hypothetical protein